MKAKNQNKKAVRIALTVLSAVTALFLVLLIALNAYVIGYADDYVVPFNDALELSDIDCIIVLGAGVRPDGSLSTVLEERVSVGAELYLSGVSEKILVSGDHSREDYNEVGAMKDYMLSRDIDKNAVFTDHAGFDTYDTMYRARDIFLAKRVIIVTQTFHISRAVFIARELGLEAYGVVSDENARYFNPKTEIREIFGRVKYVFDALFEPKPYFLGEAIPIWGEASASDG